MDYEIKAGETTTEKKIISRPFGLLLLDTQPYTGKPSDLQRDRKRELVGVGGRDKVEKGSQAGSGAKLADMSYATSGACGPVRDAVSTTDTPAALPH